MKKVGMRIFGNVGRFEHKFLASRRFDVRTHGRHVKTSYYVWDQKRFKDLNFLNLFLAMFSNFNYLLGYD